MSAAARKRRRVSSDVIYVDDVPSAVMVDSDDEVVCLDESPARRSYTPRCGGNVPKDENEAATAALVAKLVAQDGASASAAKGEPRASSSAGDVETRLLKQEQDSAYLESLKADTRKDEVALEEKAENEWQQVLAKATEVSIYEARISKLERVPTEPHSDDDAITIALRIPNAPRIVRRFRTKELISDVLNFVETLETWPASGESCQLSLSFPRKDFDRAGSGNLKLGAVFAGLKRVLLMVSEA